jgi:hypothetical protein
MEAVDVPSRGAAESAIGQLAIAGAMLACSRSVNLPPHEHRNDGGDREHD